MVRNTDPDSGPGAANSSRKDKHQLKVGERILNEGDRAIHRRNNYDFGVSNGDIGRIKTIFNVDLTLLKKTLDNHRCCY